MLHGTATLATVEEMPRPVRRGGDDVGGAHAGRGGDVDGGDAALEIRQAARAFLLSRFKLWL